MALIQKQTKQNKQKDTNMKTTLKLAMLALALAAFPAFAQDTNQKMKTMKHCASCCKQGGECCDKCSKDKCGPCCDKEEAPKK